MDTPGYASTTEREPTPGYNDAYSVGATWGKQGQKNRKTTLSPLVGRVFLVNKRTTFFLWGLVIWMLHIGKVRHPGPGKRRFLPNQLSVEFGGWLTCGDLAVDSCAQFPAAAEQRLIPSRAPSVCHFLREAGHQSVWALPVRIRLLSGHAGVRGGQFRCRPSCFTYLCDRWVPRVLYAGKSSASSTLPTG